MSLHNYQRNAKKRQALKPFRFLGVNVDIPANMQDESTWSQCTNLEVFDTGMQRCKGLFPAFGSPMFPPEHLVYNKIAGGFYWLYASSTGIGVTNGQAHFDITPATGVTSTWPTDWTSANLNGLVVINNGIDVPVYWDNQTSAIMKPLPGWPANTQVRTIRQFKNSLIAMDTTDIGGQHTNYLMWSDSADPGQIPTSWTPLPENEAGFLALADSIGALVDGQQFRNSMMLFKEHSTYLMNYIGGNFVYSIRKLFTSSGILTTDCSAEYLGSVIALTDGDLIRTDGQAAKSMIDKRMRTWLFNKIDTDNYASSFVVSYQSLNQIWICFPENGESECTLALVWDAASDNFGVRELLPTPHVAQGQVGAITGFLDYDNQPGTYDNSSRTYDQGLYNPTQDALLQADRVNNALYAVNEGNTYNGQPIIARVAREGLTFGDVSRTKLIRAVWPRVVGTAGTVLKIRVGSSRQDNDPYRWTPVKTLIIGEREKVDVYTRGRFIAVSIESDDNAPPWTVFGVDFDWSFVGRY